jgi:hypothetical protein
MALEVCQVVAEKVAEAFELGDARVLAAKFEGLLAGAVVDELELGVVPEDLQDGAVGVPKELQPWHNKLTVTALSIVVGSHGDEHDTLGSLLFLQIITLGTVIDVLRVGKLTSFTSTLFRRRDEVTNYCFK